MFVDPEDGLLFGPAVVKSYKLESQYAIYPRIVIDRDLVWNTEQDGSLANFRDYIYRGEDGAYFLDYLFGPSVTEFVVPSPENPDSTTQVQKHRDVIEGLIIWDIHNKHERIKQKYIWLALYHNSTVARLGSRLGKEFSQLGISETLLNF